MAEKDTDLGVLDNLVTQFSSPLDCFRELVQNSIDAGSPTVDVWTEYIAGDGHEGTIALHVDDYGEGMDEKIIDDQFTRLFASTKERDLTKIGKFGIGFVSVFALQPDAILVQTGRGGEYWEVLFHEDRSFTKTKLDMPVEGTQVTIFLAGDVHRYGQLVEGIQKTLAHWCNHSETDVYFEDRTPVDGAFSEPRLINEEFDVEGAPKTRVKHEGTEIVAAYSFEPVYGFYNRGLTLALTGVADDVLGTRAHRFYNIGFKIKSRYLEHTLSRETVMRDENYEKAMKLLEQAANKRLLPSLLERIEQLCVEADWSLAEVDRYGDLVGFLSREPIDLLVENDGRPILRRVDGRTLTLKQAYQTWKRDGRILFSDGPTELSDKLAAIGVPVLLGDAKSGSSATSLQAVRRVVRRYLQERVERSIVSKIRSFFGANLETETRGAIASPEAVYMPVVIDEQMPEDYRSLITRAGELLESTDAGYRKLTTCQLGSPDGDSPLFVLSRELGSVMARPPRGVAEDKAEKRPEAAVNRDHPHFRTLVRLHEKHPDLASYCLAKSLLLSADRMLDADVALMEAAMPDKVA
ncbi:MAG: ATP-binding protein [Myxococcota bacterium]